MGGLWLAHEAHAKARLSAPPPTRVLLDRHGRYLAEIGPKDGEPFGFWPVDPVPPRVASAMVAIEDRDFFDHPGVDFRAIARAIVQNTRAGERVSGASTIAMQVARMQDPAPRTYANKVVEALTAMALVERHGRHAVLAHYLRIAPYGNQIHGIGYAARRYFGKPVDDLSWAEIAFLSAIPQSPSRMNPYHWRGRQRAIARGKQILGKLAERGVLTADDHTIALEQIDRIGIPPRPVRPTAAMHAILRIERELALRPGELIVRSSLDLDLMEALTSMLDRAVFGLSSKGAENGALIVVDRDRSEVLAYLGSTHYFDVEHRGAIDYAAIPRASGSTLKPFVFGLALDRGVITPATILDDLFRAKGGIENADDRFLGPLLPRVALANSRNVPAANLADAIGLAQVYDQLARLGLHSRTLPVDHYGSGIAVGLLPVTLFDLVAAYSALAGDGRLRKPSFLEGEAPDPERAFSEDTARQITSFLSDPLARLPTFPRMGESEYPLPVALKTGTSQSYRDAWTIAYTPRFIVGAWVGRSDARPMHRLTGSSAAAVVRRAIEHLHRSEMDGLSDLSFSPPAGTAVMICPLSGKRATPACGKAFTERFGPGTAPADDCDVHVGDGHRTFVSLPPRYRAWAADRGLDLPPGLDRDEERGRPRILRPEPGSRIAIDPEVSEEHSTLALVAEVDSDVEQVVWYVDGRPFAVVESPFVARWPLSTGEHTFEARVPFTARVSAPVRVAVER
jgi:penicillin-binding protein 1C